MWTCSYKLGPQTERPCASSAARQPLFNALYTNDMTQSLWWQYILPTQRFGRKLPVSAGNKTNKRTEDLQHGMWRERTPVFDAIYEYAISTTITSASSSSCIVNAKEKKTVQEQLQKLTSDDLFWWQNKPCPNSSPQSRIDRRGNVEKHGICYECAQQKQHLTRIEARVLFALTLPCVISNDYVYFDRFGQTRLSWSRSTLPFRILCANNNGQRDRLSSQRIVQHSTRAFSIGRRSAAQPGSGPSVFVLWMFVWMSHDKSTFCVVYCHRRRRRRRRRLCGGHAERAHARAPHTHHNARLYAITCPRVRVVKLCVFFGRLRVAVIVVGDGNCRPCCVHNWANIFTI